MACGTLLDHVAVPPANVHRMPTGQADPVAAAAAYEEQLRTDFETTWPRFDIVLLGLGQDGHTASLFPEARLSTKRSAGSSRRPARPSPARA